MIGKMPVVSIQAMVAKVRAYLAKDGKSANDHARKALYHATNLGILATLFVAPLFLGGRHDLGRLVLVSTICFTSICWVLRKALRKQLRWRWTGVEWLAGLSIGLLLFQLVPLPASVIQFVSPNVYELLPTWDPTSESTLRFGTWHTLSLAPEMTRGALVLLASYWLFFFVVADQIRGLSDVERVLRWIALAAISMAVIGICQRFFGNGRFLWLYEHATRDTLTAVKGTFTNENHFAHFLALGIAPLILWVRSSLVMDQDNNRSRRTLRRNISQREQMRNILLIGGLCVVMFAGLLSFSRGGLVVVFLTSSVAVLGLAWIGFFGRRAVLGVGLAGIVVATAIVIFGNARLMEEINSLERAQSMRELSAGRVELWNSMLDAASRFPLIGTGAASHREIYPTFFDSSYNVEFSHGESGYIQIAMETGAIGIVILLAVVLTVVVAIARWWRRSPDKSSVACLIVAVAGLLASLTHSIFDFVWYIPACISMTVVLLALVCRISQLNADHSLTTHRVDIGPVGRSLATVSMLFLCAILIEQRIGPGMASCHWDRYFALSRHASAEETEEFLAGHRSVSDKLVPDLHLREMKRALAETLRWDPTHSRAMLRLASLDFRQVKQQQARSHMSLPLADIVTVANESEFDSESAKQVWVSSVLGDREALLRRATLLSERSLRISPFEGRCYVVLAEAGELFGWEGGRRAALFDQAKRVRPYDELILYKNGVEELRHGRVEEAVASWKTAFKKSPEIRSLAVDALAPIYSASQLTTLLEDDWQSLYQLYEYYKKTNRLDEATYVATPLARTIESRATNEPNDSAANLLYQAGNVFGHLKMNDDSIRCFRQATKLDPNHFSYRLALAGQLVHAERYDEALAEFKWCRRRQPRNEAVVKQLESAYRMAVTQAQPTEQAARSTSSPMH